MQTEHTQNNSSRYFINQKLTLQNFFNSAPMMMGIAEIDGNDIRHISVNEAYGLFFGKSPELMQGRLASELGIDGEIIDLWIKHYRQSEKSGSPVSFEYHLRDPKVRKYFSVTVSYIRKTNIGHSRFSCIVQDISETRIAQLELETEKHKLEAIFQNAPAAIALWRGKDLIFEKANPEYRKLFANRDIVGKKLLDALPEMKGQGFDELILKVFETGIPYVGVEAPVKIVCVEGEPPKVFYFDFSYVQIKDSTGAPYGVYTHGVDVTDKVMARRALEESKKILEKTINGLKSESDLKDYFVASLSHDMRTPLTAAKLSAQILNKHRDDGDLVHRATTRIINYMNRADSMIRDLLDANSIKAGEKLPLELGHCNLNNLVKETLDEFNAVHGERFIFQPKSIIEGRWSWNGLRRIVENLCNNAIKYGAAQSPIIITIHKENSWVSLKVHNEGNPIPDSEQINLFEPFRRSQSAQEGPQKGWGLGLTLVKGIAEAHGGTVKVESSKEAGTTFTVTIPG